MKQTSIEWLVEELTKQNMFMHLFAKEIEQAKAMEKEQIMDAWDNGWHEHMNPPSTYITSVKYYNETFKSE